MDDYKDIFSPKIMKRLPLNYYFLKRKLKQKNQLTQEHCSSTFHNSSVYEPEIFYKPISKIYLPNNDKEESI